MKRLFVLFILLSASIFAQNTYTSNYYITRIASGTLNWADTLNNNWTLVDAAIKLRQDSINSVKNNFYTQHKYDGTHQSEVITWDNLTATAKANIVQATGTQTVAGAKTFSDGISVGTEFKNTASASTNAGSLWFTPTTYSELMFRNSSANDTIPNKTWVRSNYVGTATAQTISGAKTFSAGTTFSGSVTTSGSVYLSSSAVTFDSVATPGLLAVGDIKPVMKIQSAGACSINELIGGDDGQVLILINVGVPTILLADGVTNLALSGNFLMGQYDTITLWYDSSADTWYELSRSNN